VAIRPHGDGKWAPSPRARHPAPSLGPAYVGVRSSGVPAPRCPAGRRGRCVPRAKDSRRDHAKVAKTPGAGASLSAVAGSRPGRPRRPPQEGIAKPLVSRADRPPLPVAVRAGLGGVRAGSQTSRRRPAPCWSPGLPLDAEAPRTPALPPPPSSLRSLRQGRHREPRRSSRHGGRTTRLAIDRDSAQAGPDDARCCARCPREVDGSLRRLVGPATRPARVHAGHGARGGWEANGLATLA